MCQVELKQYFDGINGVHLTDLYKQITSSFAQSVHAHNITMVKPLSII